MKTEALGCSIDGCGMPHYARGWCNAHYQRWTKHGDPLGGRTSPGVPERFYREVVLTYEGNECLIWPYSRTTGGYGELQNNGKTKVVSRRICEETHGAPPTPDHEAAHSCGKGQYGCVTKAHLSWKTPLENTADQLAHGTRRRGELHDMAKITEVEAREILALKGKFRQGEIACRYGISRSAVGFIHSGRNWGFIHTGQIEGTSP